MAVGSELPRVSDLSLPEKVGQVLMVGFPGTDPAEAREAVVNVRAGGLIYFSRNTGTVSQTARLSKALQGMAEGCGIPLLLSIDQEGGAVSRLTEGLPLMPGAMSLGAVGDPELTYEVSGAIGTQLKAAGINMDLAPVLDVNDNPRNPVIGIRSFGSDPGLVEAMGTRAVQGLMSAGIVPVAKHFPGHGNTSVDSHLDLPYLPHSLERLADVELRPFKAAIKAGVPAIMTAHIVFEAIDQKRPATLSQPVLQGLLREKLGFEGVIITDCMEMDAIRKNPGTARGAVLALAAGADIILVCHTLQTQIDARDAILDAIQQGEIPMERLDSAVHRILALKKAVSLTGTLDPEDADTQELRELSHEAHVRSITIVTHRARIHDRPKRFHVLGSSPTTVKALVDAINEDKDGDGIAEAQATAIDKETQTPLEIPDGSIPVILTRNAWKDPKAASLWNQIIDTYPGTIVVATADPYDISVLSPVDTYICTYSQRPEAMRALAQVLLGRAIAEGRLPVELPS